MRIQFKKHGREAQSSRGDGATHVVKIGFDARGSGENRPKPGKLPGFLICRDSLGSDGNNRDVDFGAMERLGFSAAQIAEAKRLGVKGEAGKCLPVALNIVIMGRSLRGEDGFWRHVGTYSEALEAWAKDGLACFGDGDSAMRKQPDGTRKKIECVPMGKTGCSAESFCPISVRGECKSHARVVFGIWVPGANGNPMPLSADYGWNARYRLDTSSGYSPGQILGALDSAADRLNGRIEQIPGILSFSLQKKRTGDGGVGLTQQLHLVLSEEDIQARERQQREYLLEDRRVMLAIPAPTPAAPPDDLESEAAAREADGPPAPVDHEDVDHATPPPTDCAPIIPPPQPAPPADELPWGAPTEPAAAEPQTGPTDEEKCRIIGQWIDQCVAAQGAGADVSAIGKAICSPLESGGKSYSVSDPLRYVEALSKPGWGPAARAAIARTWGELSQDDEFQALAGAAGVAQ